MNSVDHQTILIVTILIGSQDFAERGGAFQKLKFDMIIC